MNVEDSGAEHTWRPHPTTGPAERAASTADSYGIGEDDVVFVWRYPGGQLKGQRQRGEQSQSDDASMIWNS